MASDIVSNQPGHSNGGLKAWTLGFCEKTALLAPRETFRLLKGAFMDSPEVLARWDRHLFHRIEDVPAAKQGPTPARRGKSIVPGLVFSEVQQYDLLDLDQMIEFGHRPRIKTLIRDLLEHFDSPPDFVADAALCDLLVGNFRVLTHRNPRQRIMPMVNHLRSIRQDIEETTGINLPFNSLAATIALPAAIRDRLLEELPALEKDDTTNPTRSTRLLNPPSLGAIAAAKAAEEKNAGNGIAPYTANEGEGIAKDVPFWSWVEAAAKCESTCRRQRGLRLDTAETLAKDRATC